MELRTPGEAVWRYTYDAFGRRVGKRCVTPGQAAAVAYVWEGPRLSEAWHSGPGGEVAERWHYGAGCEPLAKEMVSAGPNGWAREGTRLYPVVTDHLGTPKEVRDSSPNSDRGVFGNPT